MSKGVNSQIITVTSRPRPLSNKSLAIAIIVLVVLIAVIVGIIVHENSQTKKPVTQSTASGIIGQECSGPSNLNILQSAAPLLINPSVTNTPKLLNLVTKIKNIPNYKEDPNCLYVIDNYYIGTSDVQNAQLYMGELQKVYNSKVGFNAVFNGYGIGFSEMQQEISALQTSAKNNQKGIVTFSSPS